MLQNIQHIHFIGIGGAGLSAIAKVLIEQGKTVSGSDQTLNPATEALAGMGATVYRGHRAQNLSGAELVVVSSAIQADNPELANQPLAAAASVGSPASDDNPLTMPGAPKYTPDRTKKN